MLKSIKTLLWATLVASLSLGFASCSSDSDDDDLGGIKVKRLPTKITENMVIHRPNGKIDQYTEAWNFEYDTANRLIDTNGSKIMYDEHGFISQIGQIPYRYNAEKKIIESLHSDGWQFSGIHYVDESGFMRSYTREDGDTHTLIYDSKRNWLQSDYVSDTPPLYKYTSKVTASYLEFYSPFAAMVCPRWLFEDDRSYRMPEFAANAVGQNMPYEIEGKTIDQQASNVFLETDKHTFEVIKSEDNYPTEIIETYTSTKTVVIGTYKRESLFTIEYKDAN